MLGGGPQAHEVCCECMVRRAAAREKGRTVAHLPFQEQSMSDKSTSRKFALFVRLRDEQKAHTYAHRGAPE